MVYGDFKDLARRTASDKILIEKSFNIAKNSKCDGYQRALASMVYKLFDKIPQVVVLIPMQIMRVLWTWLRKHQLKNYTNQ